MAEEKKQLGRILLKQKLITQEELQTALDEQRRAPMEGARPLASRLIDAGKVTETEALRALSEQCGIPGIDLTQVAVLLEHLDLVPREVAEASRILPVLVRDDRLFLAMANPSDKRVVDELEFVTGRKIFAYVATTGTLERAIAEAYNAKAAGETYYLARNVPDATLVQLGIDPKSRASARRTSGSVAPAAPSVVIDAAMSKARQEAMLTTGDFGNLGSDVSTVSALPEEPQALGQAAASGKLVLIVDDEEDIRKLLKRLLTDKGHRVIEADRGLLALRLVKEHTPDLIVLDAMLPELHGFDIARRIKGSEKYGSIPIIMVSAVYRGWRIAEDLKQNYGIEEYIEKPFRIAEVVAVVTRLLEKPTQAGVAPPRDPEAISAEAEKLLEEGVAAYKAGDLEGAIERLKQGVALDPLAYRMRYHLALLYGKRGQVYEGISELERAVELNPKHFPALKNLAVLYEKAGFKHKAVEMWERSVHAAPDAETRASIKEHLVTLL